MTIEPPFVMWKLIPGKKAIGRGLATRRDARKAFGQAFRDGLPDGSCVMVLSLPDKRCLAAFDIKDGGYGHYRYPCGEGALFDAKV